MAHKLTANQSVIYNSETQSDEILEIHTLSPDTGNYDEVLGTALHYTRVQIDGKWGLTINDWDFS